MLFAGLDNIRDVIAFPKTQKATDLMTGAPGQLTADLSDTTGPAVPTLTDRDWMKSKSVDRGQPGRFAQFRVHIWFSSIVECIIDADR